MSGQTTPFLAVQFANGLIFGAPADVAFGSDADQRLAGGSARTLLIGPLPVVGVIPLVGVIPMVGPVEVDGESPAAEGNKPLFGWVPGAEYAPGIGETGPEP